MAKSCAYFDYNASAPVKPAAREAVLRVLEAGGNPSSTHRAGAVARAFLEEARAALAALVNIRPQSIVFTSGGTEANNLAILGADNLNRIYVSAAEHPSVMEAARARGVDVETIPLEVSGVVDLDWLAAALKADPEPQAALVCVMRANNETGVIQPVEAVAALTRSAGARLLVDAAQAIGKIPVDFEALGADFLTLSAHKFGGPAGAGALILRDGARVTPRNLGGGQELRRRSGTEPLPAIAGMGAAAAVAETDRPKMEAAAALRDRIETAMLEIAPQAVVFGKAAPRLPNTSAIATPGFSSETQVMALDLAGFAVSAGSACSSGKVAPSPGLRAMGAGEDLASSAIRISLGWDTTEDEVDGFIDAWRAAYERKFSKENRTLGMSGV